MGSRCVIPIKSTAKKTSHDVQLTDIKDEFFNTWAPERIAHNTFVTRFNGEFGNGWFTTKEDTLLELFYSKDAAEYLPLSINYVARSSSRQDIQVLRNFAIFTQ